MRTVNGSGYEMATTQAIDRHGHVFLVAVVKGTFQIPLDPHEQPALGELQLPILAADRFAGEPGISATLVESDFAFRKQKCDVVIVGDAYAPGGKAVKSLDVGFEIANSKKMAHVVGPRKWIKSGQKIVTGPSDAFSVAPITYGQSFGGMWQSEDQETYECFEANPIGIGYAEADPSRLEGLPAPTVEAPGQPVRSPQKSNRPWSFGPVGRNCQPRIQYAGTYDQHWQDEVFPLQPSDFDDRFYQCVPEDQQIEYPQGGEQVVLHHLHPEVEQIRFNLPNELAMSLAILTYSNKQFTREPVVDTIVIEPAKRRFTLTWRTNIQLQRSIREVSLIASGSVCKKWWASQVYGADACGCDGIDSDEELLTPLAELI